MQPRKKATPPLVSFGVLVRETRTRKCLTQERAARGAGVSRKQWALLEQGHNVSAVFIQKVAAYLELGTIPLGDGLHATMDSGGVEVTALFALADELVTFAATFAERLRGFAIDAVLPASERSHDAEAIAAFITGMKGVAAEDSKRLGRAIQDLSSEGAVRKVPTARETANSIPRQRRRKG